MHHPIRRELDVALTGSVSHAVIRKAHCPVVIVTRGAENAIGDLSRQSEAITG